MLLDENRVVRAVAATTCKISLSDGFEDFIIG